MYGGVSTIMKRALLICHAHSEGFSATIPTTEKICEQNLIQIINPDLSPGA